SVGQHHRAEPAERGASVELEARRSDNMATALFRARGGSTAQEGDAGGRAIGPRLSGTEEVLLEEVRGSRRDFGPVLDPGRILATKVAEAAIQRRRLVLEGEHLEGQSIEVPVVFRWRTSVEDVLDGRQDEG